MSERCYVCGRPSVQRWYNANAATFIHLCATCNELYHAYISEYTAKNHKYFAGITDEWLSTVDIIPAGLRLFEEDIRAGMKYICYHKFIPSFVVEVIDTIPDRPGVFLANYESVVHPDGKEGLVSYHSHGLAPRYDGRWSGAWCQELPSTLMYTNGGSADE